MSEHALPVRRGSAVRSWGPTLVPLATVSGCERCERERATWALLGRALCGECLTLVRDAITVVLR